MKWFRKQEIIYQKPLTQGEREEALLLLVEPTVKRYLQAVMDELIRQGIYLDEKKREGAKFTVELLSGELRKGEAIEIRRRKEKSRQKPQA